MILLDTNVLSELMVQIPTPEVVEWLDRQPRTSIWTTSVTIFEIRFGLASMTTGKQKASLISSFELLLDRMIQQRIASFDSSAAHEAAALSAARRLAGRSSEIRDTMIAGIAVATRATLATRNIKHFDDLPSPVINPFNEKL